MLTIPFKRLTDRATLPTKATDGSVCFDLYIAHVTQDARGWTVHTDLAVALPQGYGMLIFPRSGLSTKLGLTLRNTVGVIDSDYRGEILLMMNRGNPDMRPEIAGAMCDGARVAQAMIIQIPDVRLVNVDQLEETSRGTGGFGSTGA